MDRKPKQLMFNYPGSKWKLAPQIVAHFPRHSIYVSAFAGTGAELAFKDRSEREIVNDIDRNVHAVFAVVQDQRLCRKLIELVESAPASRDLYYDCFDNLRSGGVGLLRRAYCFLVCATLGYQGCYPTLSRYYSGDVAKHARRLELLPGVLTQWQERLRFVTVENGDVFDLIDKYDAPGTFFFFDPPYHHGTRCHGVYLHDHIDHRHFVHRLQRLEGKALVCGYPHGLYDIRAREKFSNEPWIVRSLGHVDGHAGQAGRLTQHWVWTVRIGQVVVEPQPQRNPCSR
jgi:DNA adenine methylase